MSHSDRVGKGKGKLSTTRLKKTHATTTTTTDLIVPSTTMAPQMLHSPPSVIVTPSSSPITPPSSTMPSPFPTIPPHLSTMPSPFPSIPHPPTMISGTFTTQPPGSIPPSIPTTFTTPPSSSTVVPPGQSPPVQPMHTSTTTSSQESLHRQTSERAPLIPSGYGFNDDHMVTHALVEILKSKYDGPYSSWKKIPKRTRDMWFREFEKKFQWVPEDEHYIRRNWERRGSSRLADMFSKARENRDRKPDWIGEGVWHELWKYWDSDEFKARSQKNKKNRASDCNGLGFPLHTSGSISINDHATRLTQKLNRAPTLDELFRHTHQKKKDGNQWINKKAEISYTNFIQKWQEVESSQSSTGEDGAESSQQQPQPSMMHIWKETVGVNKGRIYGLGSQASLLIGSSSSRTSFRVPEEWIQERERIYNMFETVSARNEELAHQNSQLASQNNELSARISRTEEFMHLMMEKMQVNSSTVSAPSPAATSANDDDCDVDDDDHEEEDL